MDPDDIETYGGSVRATDWKREARERDPGPDTAPDGSLVYPGDDGPTEDPPDIHLEFRPIWPYVLLFLIVVGVAGWIWIGW